MNILYISCYPDKYFRHIITNSKFLSSQPSQKYNKLIVEGLKSNDCDISVLSTFNHLRWESEKLYFKGEIVEEEDIKYYFLPFIKLRIVNYFYMHYAISKFLYEWKKKSPNGVIVIDFLKPYSYHVHKYGKGNNIVTIITDLPEHQFCYKGIINRILNKIRKHHYDEIIQMSTHYVFLTEQMNLRLNKKNKPYCIIEGLVDSKIKKLNVISKSKSKVCLYSGGLSKKSGIHNLVKAFTSDELNIYELHLYGTGDYVIEIEEIIKKYHNIKFYGNVENKVVVRKQMEATVLINPRPTHDEYTKFSFPSKNIEYMVSGTPVITTDLPGIPIEYKEHVYILDGSETDDIIRTVSKILSMPEKELEHKGLMARNFVLSNKNNIIQSKKILDIVSTKFEK